MTTTSRGNATRTRRTRRPVRRRRQNTLGSFMLWAFFSWLFAKTNHRGPMRNPYARPGERIPKPRKQRGPGRGGGGGASGHGQGEPARTGPAQKRAPLDTEDGPDDGGFFTPKGPRSDNPDDGGFFSDDAPDTDADADDGDDDDGSDGDDDDSGRPGYEPTSEGAV